MANNQYVNKVVFGNETLIDLSSDTANAGDILTGHTAHDASGAPITGTIPFRTGSDITATYGARSYQSTDHVLYMNFPSGYYSYGALKLDKIYVQVPASGTNTIDICVPNGTTTPDISDDDDWIPITFSVDSNGNSNITDDTIPASGVSF